MRLLRLISWPYFRKHVLRTMLTTAGIVLGVAVWLEVRRSDGSNDLHPVAALAKPVAPPAQTSFRRGATSRPISSSRRT